MAGINLHQFRSSNAIIPSLYELNFIIEKLSGILERPERFDTNQLGLIELIYCLAKEIEILKNEKNEK